MTRTFIKVARKAEYDGGYTTLTEVAGGVPTGDGTQGEKGEKGDTGPEGPPGKDGVVDPSKLNMEFNVDQIDLKDADGNFCGLHVKGTNGITVSEDPLYGNQTMVIGLPEGYGNNEEIEARLLEGETKQGEIEETISSALIDQQLIKNELVELSTQRGAVREFTVKAVEIAVASRDGELVLGSPEAWQITDISMGIRDNNGNETPPIEAGDILDLELEGVINRYTVTGGTAQGLNISYQVGDSEFAVGDSVNVYIYPQNSSSASKEYVDAQDAVLKEAVDELDETRVEKSGDTVTGKLKLNSAYPLDFQGGNETNPYQTLLFEAPTNGVAGGHKFRLNGSTYKNVIQFTGGSGGDREILTLGSDMKVKFGDAKNGQIDINNNRLHKVADGTQDTDGVSLKQVQDLIAASQAVQGTRPANLAWRWRGRLSDSESKPSSQDFYLGKNDYLRFSFLTANGIDLGWNVIEDTDPRSTQYGPLGTIWYKNRNNSNQWQLERQFRIDNYRWNKDGHVEFKLSSSTGTDWENMAVSRMYYVTIGGFF